MDKGQCATLCTDLRAVRYMLHGSETRHCAEQHCALPHKCSKLCGTHGLSALPCVVPCCRVSYPCCLPWNYHQCPCSTSTVLRLSAGSLLVHDLSADNSRNHAPGDAVQFTVLCRPTFGTPNITVHLSLLVQAHCCDSASISVSSCRI
jgi:hypothetical protein